MGGSDPPLARSARFSQSDARLRSVSFPAEIELSPDGATSSLADAGLDVSETLVLDLDETGAVLTVD